MDEQRRRYLLLWLDRFGPISLETVRPIRRAIEDKVTEAPDQVEIDVWLDSGGGDANAAYKLALMLRETAGHVRVVVPDFAKSAATLLALAGDEIFLAPAAELGPLDAQMPEEGSYLGSISALNIARAADEAAREAVDLAVSGGARLISVTGLTRAQTIDAMLRFSAAISEPLVRQLDPKLVHHAKQMLRVTARYAERLLTMSGCENANLVAKRLVENYPTHGFVIDAREAEVLGLPVARFAEYDQMVLAREYHRMAEDGTAIVEFGQFEEFFESGDADDEDADTEIKDDDTQSSNGRAGGQITPDSAIEQRSGRTTEHLGD